MGIDAVYLAEFKANLLALSAEEMVARYVVSETCHGLAGVDQSSLRGQIAEHFQIASHNVLIVGSAKLGFTSRNRPAKGDADERRPSSEFNARSDVGLELPRIACSTKLEA
jgi:hypothetical protein